MNLKLKYTLLPLLQSIVPFVMLILAPYVGLHAKTPHMRLVQIIGGVATIALIWVANYFLGYERERDIKAIFDAIRGRGTTVVSVGYDVRP